MLPNVVLRVFRSSPDCPLSTTAGQCRRPQSPPNQHNSQYLPVADIFRSTVKNRARRRADKHSEHCGSGLRMRFTTAILGALFVATTAGCRTAPTQIANAERPSAGLVRTAPRTEHPSRTTESDVRQVAHQAQSDWEPVAPTFGQKPAVDANPEQESGEKSVAPGEDTDAQDEELDEEPNDDTGLSVEQLVDGSLEPNTLLEDTLSLADFETLAVYNSPIVQHAAARVTVAQGQHLQAGLYPNPIIGYHGVNIGNNNTSGRQAGFIQQRFVTGGKLQLDQDIECREIQVQEQRLIAARQRVLTDVRSRFYEAIVAQRREELTGQLVQIATELATSTDKLLEAEQTSENAFLQAEIEVEQASILDDNAANATLEAWHQLTAVAGEPDLPLTKLAGDIDGTFVELNLQELTDAVLDAHPLVAAARARVDKASVVIERAHRENIPDIEFLADAARTNQTGFNTAQARLAIEIPLWDKNQGNILSAQAESAAARAEVRRVELELQQRLAVVFRQYSNALHQAKRYRDRILPKSERSLELVLDGYDNGQIEYRTLLSSRQSFVEVNLAYTDSLEELQKAAALLEGQLLTDSLAAD